MKTTSKRPRCPYCGSTDIVRTRFGFPDTLTPEEKAAVEAGQEIEEAGDVGTQHDRRCRACGHRWDSRKRRR